jgi:DNA-binding IclR family transcriptional regulator
MVATGSMALLMALQENERNDVIARNGRRYRNHGALSEEQVRAMLLDSLDIGFGLNRSRIIAGISGVGVSIPTSAEAAYAALSIAAIDARILDEGRQRELLLMLKHEAQTISRELGCRG